jgi:IclR family acetate operon transcriptional repressor
VSRVAADNGGQTIAAIERAVDVLLLFGDGDDATLGVTEIAARLDLSKAVVHRILSSFRAKGFVEVDETTHRYQLGPAVARLGLVYLDRVDVRSVARPVLERLSAETDETATLSIRTGWTRVYIDQVTPARDVKMVVQLGHAVPLHAGASSKAILAFLPASEIDGYLDEVGLERLTDVTITSVRALKADLTAVRQRGYATSKGERLRGAASVAVPIFGHDGSVSAAMSVSGPVERFQSRLDEVGKVLVHAAEDVSSRLGHRRT